jgi:hypothetical protein
MNSTASIRTEKTPLKHTKHRDAAERRFVRQTAKQSEQERRERAANAALSNWIAVASPSTTFVRVELTFKLRVMTALGKRTRAVEPAREPSVRYTRVPSAVVPTWKADVDESAVQNVRAQQHRPSLKSAPLFATTLYLPENEPARVAVMLINALNRHFFKGRSRRAINPERLTVLACVHNRDDDGKKCRPHVHALIALPPNVTVDEFAAIVRRVVEDETFINRRLMVELVADIAASVFYNADPDKHSDRAPVILIHPPCPLRDEEP